MLNREFNQEQELKVVVSDLTYVRADQKWHYICILVDLYKRETIPNKTASLFQRAFPAVSYNLNQLEFNTDRGNEFKSKLIYDALDAFDIKQSLSKKDLHMTMLWLKRCLKPLRPNLQWHQFLLPTST